MSFRQVHAADGGRIRYKRVCELDGEEVPYSDIAKGYELPDGEIVVLSDEDFSNLPLASSKEIDVMEFVPAEQIDPMLYNKAYYAEPDKSADQAVRADARHAGRQRPGRGSEGHAAVQGGARRAARDRRRARGAHPAVARGGPRRRIARPADRGHRAQAGNRDGQQLHRLAVRGLRPLRVHRRVQGRGRGACRGQDGRARGDRGRAGNGGGEVIDLVEALRASVEAAKAKRSGSGSGSGFGSGSGSGKAKAAEKKEPAKRAPRRKTG